MPTPRENYIQDRVNVPSGRSSQEWNAVDPKIRAQSFFSARVAEAHVLDRIRQVSDDFSNGKISQGEARIALKNFVRENGLDDGSRAISNLGSTARLNLILRQNAAMARAAGRYERMNDPEVKRAFPFVIYHSKKDVFSRDGHAALDGKIFSKDDPFLATHTPPWEFNCRCWLEDCDRDTAEKHGVEPVTPPENVHVDSESGFAFNPAHAFETFDCGSIHEPIGRANVMDMMATKFPATSQEIYRANAEGYLEGKAEEIKLRMAVELPQKVLPKNPKEFLQGEDLEKAEEQARKAVKPEVMKKTDDAVEKNGIEELNPFYHYSSRPEKGENFSIRYASDKNGVMNWNKISPKNAKKIRDLDSLCDKMPKFQGTLYRGCCYDDPDEADKYIDRIMGSPESLSGYVSMTPDPVLAVHYSSSKKHRIVLVVPNSKNAVYFGPYSKHPEDEEALLSRKFYLRGLKKIERDGTVYIIAEEVQR